MKKFNILVNKVHTWSQNSICYFSKMVVYSLSSISISFAWKCIIHLNIWHGCIITIFRRFTYSFTIHIDVCSFTNQWQLNVWDRCNEIYTLFFSPPPVWTWIMIIRGKIIEKISLPAFFTTCFLYYLLSLLSAW